MADASLEPTWRRRAAFGAAAAAGLAVAGGWLRRWQWDRRLRDARRRAKEGADPLRQGFSMRKLPAEIDHVIIGSGLSGLYLGALLSKIGRRVVVLEQHYVVGGCTHTFKDKGFEFDTGVHYVGQASVVTALMDFGAGRTGAFRMQRQGSDDGSEVYNEYHWEGGVVHRARPGPWTFVNDLIARFPEEKAAIRRYFSDLQMSGMGFGLLFVKHFMPAFLFKALLAAPTPLRWVAKRYVKRTLDQALTDSGIKSGALRALLSAEYVDYGMTPDRAPFFMHGAITEHYMAEGGFYPTGGSDAFALALVPRILDAGGAVLVRAPVSRIVVEGGRAVGVEVGDKGVIHARRSVISAAGAEVTYRRLLDEIAVAKTGGPPRSLIESEAKGSAHHVYAFVGLDGTKEELRLPSHNVISFPHPPDADPSRMWRALLEGGAAGRRPEFLTSDAAFDRAQLPVYISFPSAKDSKYNARCPGKSSCVILTEARAEYFGNAGPASRRTEEYAGIKQKYQQLLLRALYRHFPHLQEKASYVDVGTAWSNEHYLGRKGSYGLDHDAARFLDPSLRVKVMPGLYLTGQDILSDGIFTQPLCALITLSKVLGLASPDFALVALDLAWFVLRRVVFDRTYAPSRS